MDVRLVYAYWLHASMPATCSNLNYHKIPTLLGIRCMHACIGISQASTVWLHDGVKLEGMGVVVQIR